MMPRGLVELTKIVIDQDPLPEKPRTLDDIWDKFTGCAVIGPIRNNAENNFIHEILKDILSRESVKGDDWIRRASEIVRKSKSSTMDTEKIGVLKQLDQELVGLNETLKHASEVFENRVYEGRRISPELFEHLANHSKAQEFVSQICHPRGELKISGFGLVKTILWLHGCGVGHTMVPPTNHIKSFLEEYYNMSLRPDQARRRRYTSEDEAGEDWYVFSPINQKFGEIATQMAPKLSIPPTARDAGVAVFWYKSTQNLLYKTSAKPRFTLERFLDFLKDEFRGRLESLGDKLFDIDSIEELENRLRDYMG